MLLYCVFDNMLWCLLVLLFCECFVVLQVLCCVFGTLWCCTGRKCCCHCECFVVLWVLCACKCGCMWCCTGRKCCDHTAHKHWTFLLQLFPLLLLRLCPSLSSSQETQIKVFSHSYIYICLDPPTYLLHTTTQAGISMLNMSRKFHLSGWVPIGVLFCVWMQNHCW